MTAADGSVRASWLAAFQLRAAHAGSGRAEEVGNDVVQMLDPLTVRCGLTATDRQVLARRLAVDLPLLSRAQRAWLGQLTVAVLLMLVTATAVVGSDHAPGSIVAVYTVTLTLSVPAMALIERRRQRRAASTLLLVRLLRHAARLGGDAAEPSTDGRTLRRNLLQLETTASIAGIDLGRQLTGGHPNADLRAAAKVLARWLRSAAGRVALAGPAQIVELRQELAQVAVAFARDGVAGAAHVAAVLMPVPAQQGQAAGRRAAWVTGLRLVSAELLLLLMRHVTAGFSSELRWSLDAAIGAIAVAGAGWIAVGLEPQAALLSRWRRWAAEGRNVLRPSRQ